MHPQHSGWANADIDTQLRTLRRRAVHMIGSLVASSDGLLISYDLPPEIEPTSVAALAAAQLSLSLRFVATTHGSDLSEVVMDGGYGQVVVYAAGPTASLTVLTDTEATLGRMHLDARPVSTAIASILAAQTSLQESGPY
ncbi:roadblock/LC7 domain-containing protein [Nocardia brasiliensis]|uniref:roadblock/LC7 domain-containing protein n=1 Tax=Nocardia brasiliensis TaxID=37326 RepID=UPI0024579291|nr:roadblock/LC7 domain-containing protein [Nocardia brasiliensis]